MIPPKKKSEDQRKFEEDLAKLQENFTDAGRASDSDKKLGDALLELILQRERLRRGVHNQPKRWKVVDRETLQKMATWDTDDPELLTCEKVLRRLAKGRGADATALLKASIQSKISENSKRQSKFARTPRAPSDLNSAIDQIVVKRPDITEKELTEKLEDEKYGGCIEDMDNDTISLVDGQVVKTSSLKDRLSRAKKRYRANKKR